MRRVAIAAASIALAALASCGRDASVPTEAALSGPEADLAINLAGTADSVARLERHTMDHILQAFFNRLREQDNPDARALLATSRALADSGRAAAQAGNRDVARRYFKAAHEVMFDAIVLVLPGANSRVAASVDTIRARMLLRLDTAAAPRIRRALAFVAGLRARADSALAAGDAGAALGLNVRAIETLRALHRHLQNPGDNGLPGDQGGNPPPPPPGDIPLPPPPGGGAAQRPGSNPPPSMPGRMRPGLG